MKVFLAFVFTISAVSSLGSGPYLPSGWKPSGPAFLLPSEVWTAPKLIETNLEVENPEAIVSPSEPSSLEVKTPETTDIPTETTASEDRITKLAEPTEPVQDVSGQETEASGSDFLREYGPPAVLDIHQSVTVQGLPDIVTEQSFRVDDAKNSQSEPVSLTSDDEVIETFNGSDAPEKENASVENEPKSSVEEVLVQTDTTVEVKSGQDASTTESAFVNEISEGTTAKIEEPITEEGTTPSQSETEDNDEEKSVLLVKSIINTDSSTEGTSLEYLPPVSNEELSQGNEVITKEDAVILEVPMNPSNSVDCDSVVKSEINKSKEKVEESSGLGQAPDVLSEQERVGFREYGPPISGSEGKTEAEKIENNETRRRRFLSKFVSFNKQSNKNYKL